MSDENNTDQYPMHPRGPKHSALQISKIPLVLTIYSVPAVIELTWWPFQSYLSQHLISGICLGIPLIWLLFGIIVHAETLPDIGFLKEEIGGIKLLSIVGFPRSGKWAPESNPVAPPTRIEYTRDHDLDTLRVEYQSLISEAQYRDKLLIRTTYFALGTFGLFAGILSTDMTVEAVPAVAMIASVVMLAFAIAANSYKDSRDALWDRIGRLENSVPAFRGYLTTYNTVRMMDLRLLNTVSLSSYAVGMTIFMTAAAYIVYVWSVYTLP